MASSGGLAKHVDAWEWDAPDEPQRLSERATYARKALVDRPIFDVLTGSTDVASTLFVAFEVRAFVTNAFASRAIVRCCFETLADFEHYVSDAYVVTTSQKLTSMQ